MSCRSIPPAEQAKQRGFTLLEVLLAMAIGLFILAGLTGFLYSLSKTNTTTLRMIHLRQTLRGIMTTMSGEIRRTGYWRQAAKGGNHYAAVNIIAHGCLLYSYDRSRDDPDGRPDADDRGGFRLLNGTISRKTSDRHCGATSCQDCNTGRWWRMNDNHSLLITRLRFTLIRTPPAPTTGRSAQGITITLGGELIRQPEIKLSLQQTVYLADDTH